MYISTSKMVIKTTKFSKYKKENKDFDRRDSTNSWFRLRGIQILFQKERSKVIKMKFISLISFSRIEVISRPVKG